MLGFALETHPDSVGQHIANHPLNIGHRYDHASEYSQYLSSGVCLSLTLSMRRRRSVLTLCAFGEGGGWGGPFVESLLEKFFVSFSGDLEKCSDCILFSEEIGRGTVASCEKKSVARKQNRLHPFMDNHRHYHQHHQPLHHPRPPHHHDHHHHHHHDHQRTTHPSL